VVAAQNGALQEIFSRRADMFARTASFRTAAPDVRACTVSGSTITVPYTDAAEDLTGCSVKLGSQANEFSNRTNAGSYTLLYTATAGAVSATIYRDAFRVSAGVYARLLGPPAIPGYRPLNVLGGQESWRGARSDGYLADYGDLPVGGDELDQDVPTSCWIQTRLASGCSAPHIIFRVAPVPDGAYDIRCEVAIIPTKVEAIDDDWDFPLDPVLHESVLLPVARWLWTRNPYWQKPDVVEQVKDGYRAALDTLLAHRVDTGTAGELIVNGR
jgi:hypothetical protein